MIASFLRLCLSALPSIEGLDRHMQASYRCREIPTAFQQRKETMKSQVPSRLFVVVLAFVLLLSVTGCVPAPVPMPGAAPDLWQVYNQSLKGAKYIDLTHTLTPSIPVWKGFGPAKFGATINPETGKPYQYDPDGFEATRYELSTDQYGTQLDPPAHWAPEYPAIDELPATYSVRPLVIISIVEKVAKDPGYSLQVS